MQFGQAAATPLARNAATFIFCQVSRSWRITRATLVSNCMRCFLLPSFGPGTEGGRRAGAKKVKTRAAQRIILKLAQIADRFPNWRVIRHRPIRGDLLGLELGMKPRQAGWRCSDIPFTATLAQSIGYGFYPRCNVPGGECFRTCFPLHGCD